MEKPMVMFLPLLAGALFSRGAHAAVSSKNSIRTEFKRKALMQVFFI